MKRIAVIGSTGSIGRNTLDVIRQFPDKFRVAALCAHSNVELLSAQAREFKPELVCLTGQAKTNFHKPGKKAKFFRGFLGLEEMLEDRRIDMVVMAIGGSSALLPLWKAIELKKEIATANKEALVMAGGLISRLAAEKQVKIIPIDSEQSAIWQCLEKEDPAKLEKIYLTASGGPFRLYSKAQLENITLKDALMHPRWKMGKKITVDSATLMNKGLEVLEAMCLFKVSAGDIKVVIHPESIIHSMVEFVDGVVMAQLSQTDMRIPIRYAMSYPQRLKGKARKLNFFQIKSLNFAKPDFEKFPCLALAFSAARDGGTMPAVMNAANEVSVAAFMEGKLGFISIAEIIGKVMRRHRSLKDPTLNDVLDADSWARIEALSLIGE
ncbi:MAG: 1-deoxy-D-xylulose-5-phosphate reductoisomerase [Candidatus Omnitrophica bacterium]|nr:1-deoxy-D-xylulose-5-phosphate reductoisomerase [Candidatus Omnitrophota bacterium]